MHHGRVRRSAVVVKEAIGEVYVPLWKGHLATERHLDQRLRRLGVPIPARRLRPLERRNGQERVDLHGALIVWQRLPEVRSAIFTLRLQEIRDRSRLALAQCREVHRFSRDQRGQQARDCGETQLRCFNRHSGGTPSLRYGVTPNVVEGEQNVRGIAPE